MDELKEWLEEIAAWENRWKRLRRTFGKKLDKMTVGEIMKIGRTPRRISMPRQKGKLNN